MAFIEWTEQMSVGVQEIDEQHKKLVNMLNQLFESMQKGKSSHILKTIIHELVEYTKVHFATEEKYFHQFGYAEKDAHITEHENFVATLENFISDYNSGKIGVSSGLLRFLRKWLFAHIMGSDKKYTNLLIQNGVK